MTVDGLGEPTAHSEAKGHAREGRELRSRPRRLVEERARQRASYATADLGQEANARAADASISVRFLCW